MAAGLFASTSELAASPSDCAYIGIFAVVFVLQGEDSERAVTTARVRESMRIAKLFFRSK